MKVIIMEIGEILDVTTGEIIRYEDQKIDGDVNNDYKPIDENVFPSIDEIKCADVCQPRESCHSLDKPENDQLFSPCLEKFRK